MTTTARSHALPSGRITRLISLDDRTPLPVGLVAAALCLAVGLAHVQDQGGFLGDVTPDWIKVGYYAVEIGAAFTIPFLVRQRLVGWGFSALVGIGPFVAYILSRSIGLPGDPGDVGNWSYTLGTVSLVLEGTLFLLSVAVLLGHRLPRPSRGGEQAGS